MAEKNLIPNCCYIKNDYHPNDSIHQRLVTVKLLLSLCVLLSVLVAVEYEFQVLTTWCVVEHMSITIWFGAALQNNFVLHVGRREFSYTSNDQTARLSFFPSKWNVSSHRVHSTTDKSESIHQRQEILEDWICQTFFIDIALMIHRDVLICHCYHALIWASEWVCEENLFQPSCFASATADTQWAIESVYVYAYCERLAMASASSHRAPFLSNCSSRVQSVLW